MLGDTTVLFVYLSLLGVWDLKTGSHIIQVLDSFQKTIKVFKCEGRLCVIDIYIFISLIPSDVFLTEIWSMRYENSID